MVLNGVIHSVDSVLTPSDVSISEYLGTHETQFADLYAALVLEGLENALECKRKKREKFIISMDLFSCDFSIWHFFSAGTFTIFAPQDSAFAQILANLPSITADDSYFKSRFDPYSSNHFETYNSISIYFYKTSVLTLYKFDFFRDLDISRGSGGVVFLRTDRWHVTSHFGWIKHYHQFTRIR